MVLITSIPLIRQSTSPTASNSSALTMNAVHISARVMMLREYERVVAFRTYLNRNLRFRAIHAREMKSGLYRQRLRSVTPRTRRGRGGFFGFLGLSRRRRPRILDLDPIWRSKTHKRLIISP